MRSVAFLSGLMTAGICACVLSGGAAASTEGTQPSQTLTQTTGVDVAVGAPDAAFDTFLDRLMRAESNGLSHAKNPRSSALGPFQFINSTFLAVMRQHFPGDIARLGEGDILALRTKHEVARRAAKAFSRDNMAYLMERGVTPTFGHLRLAFLLGPEGAARVLKAPPGRPVADILEDGVIVANPFMRRMTAADLVARAARDVSPKPGDRHGTADGGGGERSSRARPGRAAEPEQPAPARPRGRGRSGGAGGYGRAPGRRRGPGSPAPETADAKADHCPKAAETKAAETKAAPTATARAGRITARRLDRPAVINVKCDSRLASCQRWIDREVDKLIRVADRG